MKISQRKLADLMQIGGLDIDKNGIEQAQANDEIKYSFNSLKNTSNVALDNFTWTDNLPYDYVRITKLFTGTYNEDLDYIVKYKTNKSEDYIEYGKFNTQKNNYIDFTKLAKCKKYNLGWIIII